MTETVSAVTTVPLSTNTEIEFKGEEFVYLIGTETINFKTFNFATDASKVLRPLNQTDGDLKFNIDKTELKTKDKKGASPSKPTLEFSFEGIFSVGDVAQDKIRECINNQQLIPLILVNTRTGKAEGGMCMISSYELKYSNEEHVTYSLDLELNGDFKALTTDFKTVPAGAK